MKEATRDNPLFQRTQDFGAAPTDLRETHHSRYQYAPDFMERWDDLIDREDRAASEGRVFIDVLKQYGGQSVIDAATGTGFQSVPGLKAGFALARIDGSRSMLPQTVDTTGQRGTIGATVHSHRRGLSRDMAGRYVAAICRSNALPYPRGTRAPTLARRTPSHAQAGRPTQTTRKERI